MTRSGCNDTAGCLGLLAIILIGVLIGVTLGLVGAILYGIVACLVLAWLAST